MEKLQDQISSYHPGRDPLSPLRPQRGCMVWTHTPPHVSVCTLSHTSLLPHPQTYHPLSDFCVKCVPPPLALSNCPLPSDLSSKAFPAPLCEFCPSSLFIPCCTSPSGQPCSLPDYKLREDKACILLPLPLPAFLAIMFSASIQCLAQS